MIHGATCPCDCCVAYRAMERQVAYFMGGLVGLGVLALAVVGIVL